MKTLTFALFSLSISATCLAGNYYGVKCTSNKTEIKIEFLGSDDGKGDHVTINGKEEAVLDIGSDSLTERYETRSKNFKVSYDVKSGLGTMKLNNKLLPAECSEL